MRKVGGKGAASVLPVALNVEAMGTLRETLSGEAVVPDRSVSYGDALGLVNRQKPDVVVVSFNESVEAALALANTIRKDSPDVTMVALAAKSNAGEILQAMRAGYKEYVVLPDDANRLRTVVKEAAFADSGSEEGAQVVAVLGAKGGVGTTTLVTHLGADLAAIHRVCVIDLDFGCGDVASMLDVTPKDTLADLLPRAERLDERMLTAAVAVHRSKVHVLAQPSELFKIDKVNADDVYNIIGTAAKAYMFVLLDCGARMDIAAELAVSVADVILLVTTPDVVSVRDAFRRLKHLEQLGVEADRIRLVVNRDRKGAYISTADIEANLNMKVAVKVSEDSKTVDQAINDGQLVRDVNRKSDVARDISKLVALLTDDAEGEPEKEEESKGGFFSNWFGGGKG